MFANKCLNVLIALKDHWKRVLGSEDVDGCDNDYKVIFPADVVKLKNFITEFDEVVKQHSIFADNHNEDNRALHLEDELSAEKIEEDLEKINNHQSELNCILGVTKELSIKVEDSEENKSNIENIYDWRQRCEESSEEFKSDQQLNKSSFIPQTVRMTRSNSGKWKVLRHDNQPSPPTEPVQEDREKIKEEMDGQVINDLPNVTYRKVLNNKRSLNCVKTAHKFGPQLACVEPDCDFTTPYPSNMRSHKMKHMNEKPFVCKMIGCGKLFKSLYRLHFHIKNVHTSERNHRCEFEGCGKAFKSRMSLKQHSLIHSTLKYVCEYPDCNYKTPFLSNIKSHNLKHTPDRNFVCEWPQCHKKFKSRHYLAFHLKKHKHEFPLDMVH